VIPALLLAIAAPADGGAHETAAAEVLTFRGLLELEKDAHVSDERKLREWQDFIVRSKEQLEYASAAVDRWTIAPRIREFEATEAEEQKPSLGPRDKSERWKAFATKYPRTPEAVLADKRAGEWRGVETQRLAQALAEVERSGAHKLDRIKAALAIVEWAPASSEGRAAVARIQALEAQLYAEALNIDAIRGVDRESKLEAWKDVLAGAPTPAQRSTAQRRVTELSPGGKR
jgi:hypothetical protein